MSGQRRATAIAREAGADLYALLRRGHGAAACYDAAAAPLYQYCWALVGPGHIRERRHGDPELSGASAAVVETFLTAASQIRRLGDPADFPAWLFALARAACHRQGFAPSSPYAALATVPDERPIIDALTELPPSQRELLELALRHGLTPAQRGRVLGLDAEMAGELTHTAVRRTADLLRTPGPWRVPDATDIGDLMALVPPPLPPQELRGLVLAGCEDPTRTAEWGGQAHLLFPLGADGFPRHRDSGPATPPPAEEAAAAAAPAVDPQRAELHTERLTTEDVPARLRAEQLAEIVPDDEPTERERRRGRWFVPAVAGVLTVLTAAGIWGTATILTDVPVGGMETGEATGPDLSPAPTESPAPTAPPRASAPEPLPQNAPTREDTVTEEADPQADDLAADDAVPHAAADEQHQDHPDPDHPPDGDPPTRESGGSERGSDREAAPPPPEAAEEDDGDGGGGGGGGLWTGLWEGIRGIIGGGSGRESQTEVAE